MIQITRQYSSHNFGLSTSSVDSSNNVYSHDSIMDTNALADSCLNLESDLIQIIEKKIGDAGFIFHLGLTSKEVSIITLLLKQQPEIFSDIGKQISTIVTDGNVDLRDIPQLVLLMKDIINFKSTHLSNLNITVKDLIDFIENVLIILLESGVIKTNDTILYENILKSSVALLESSIQLNQSIETVTCGCSFWPWSSKK
jgi:hypothetical protein